MDATPGKMACGSVTLRSVEESDYVDIQGWKNEPEVFAQMDYEHPFALDDIKDAETKARDEGNPYIIEVDGVAVGRIGLNNFSTRDGRASLYIFIGVPSQWGKGYGTDAIIALLQHAFDRMDIHLIELWGIEGNDRAFACYAHCGFVRDAALRERSFHDGAHRARVVMSVTREEFAQASAAWIAARSSASQE